METSGQLPNFADLLLDTVFMVDVHGQIVHVSAACERMFGYTPEEMIGHSLLDFVAPEDRARTLEESRRVMAGAQRIGFENRYRRKDGRHVSIMWSARWLEAEQLRIGVARDVTERKRSEEMQAAIYAISEAAHTSVDLAALFREIHRIIANLVPAAELAITLIDEQTGQLNFVYCMDLHGNSSVPDEAVARELCTDVFLGGRAVIATQHGRASDASEHEHERDASSGASWLAVPLKAQNETIGTLILKSHSASFYVERDKDLLQYVSVQVATAIERRRLHAELLHAARYDELTGLPNRRLFYDRAHSALARSRRNQTRVAMLYIDIDDFKQVNDAFGHAAGDLLLQEVAARLRQCVRGEDTVARLSGDEFVVLLERIQLPGDAELVAAKLQSAISEPMHIEASVLHIVPSIGLALYPDHGAELEQLLKHADNAMYSAKKSRRASAHP